MTSIDVPDDALSKIHCDAGGTLTMELVHVTNFRNRHPDLYAALIECSAFVNWRRNQRGDKSVRALSFST